MMYVYTIKVCTPYNYLWCAVIYTYNRKQNIYVITRFHGFHECHAHGLIDTLKKISQCCWYVFEHQDAQSITHAY